MKNIKLILISLLVVGIAFAGKDEEGMSKVETEKAEYEVKTAEASNSGNITKGLAGVGAGLVVIGAGIGIGGIFGRAAEATARQPEAASKIQTAMIIIGALLEGLAFGALILGK